MNYQINDYHIPAAICDNLYGYEINLVKHWASIKPGSCFTSTADNTIFVLNPGKLNKNNGPDIINATLVIDGVFVQGLKMIDKNFCEPMQCGICPLKETYGNFN